MADYDLETASAKLDRDEIVQRLRGMWRWQELLPVFQPENIISLGEGDTNLLPARRLGEQLGLPRLFIKDESSNPTGSFKARGMAAAVSKAKELGLNKLVIPTAGNAGGAMAAYSARAGIQAMVIMPADSPLANIKECQVMGAEVILVEGLISDAAVLARQKSQDQGWFDLSTFREPYRCEGKKIMGYELAQAFHWELPDVIIYPTGGGTGLVGMWKAFAELEFLGWLKSKVKPRMVAVQAEGCAPVVKAFQSRDVDCDFWAGAQTIASGLRVPRSFASRIIMQDLYQSGGCAVSVNDSEIISAQKNMAVAEGVFAAPEGAATLAALTHLLDRGWIRSDERIVLFNTGSGLKYLA